MGILGEGRRRLYLMRHGDVAYYDSNGIRVAEPDLVDLTERGREEAAAMGEELKHISFDRTFCTSLKRTRQTAELALGGRPDVALEEVPVLREIKSGNGPMLTREQALSDMVYAFDRAHEPGMAYAYGEKFTDFYDRVSSGIETLLLRDDWETMLLVAHGGVNRAIFSWATGAGLHGMGRYEQDTACLNILDVDVEDGRIGKRFLRLVNWRPDELWRTNERRTSTERFFASRADA